jgi:hypothetical protein
MATFTERSMQSVISQVPLLMQGVFSSMEGIMNVAPLQMLGLTSSQLLLMLTKDMQTLQGSRSSTRVDSTQVSIALPHCFPLNPDMASSFVLPKSAVASEALTKDMKDVAQPTVGEC